MTSVTMLFYQIVALPSGLTPLHYASELESARILETLLDGGGEPNARDKEGWFGVSQFRYFSCTLVKYVAL